MRGWLSAASAAGVLLLLTAGTVSAAPGSFVYVASRSCTSTVCATNVNVIDATSSALVTTIPIGSVAVFGLAVSPDGSRVYVSALSGTNSSVIVVDATRHQASSSFAVASFGGLAVSRDGRLLFIGGEGPAGLYIYDLTSQQQVTSIPSAPGIDGVFALVADPQQDRVYWFDHGGCISEFHAYDTAIASTVATNVFDVSRFLWSNLFMSRDGTRLYLTAPVVNCQAGTGDVRILQPASFAPQTDLGPTSLTFPVGTIDAPGRGRLYIWTNNGSVGVFNRDTFAPVAEISIQNTTSSMAISGDESRGYVTSPFGQLEVINLATNVVDRTVSVPGFPGSAVDVFANNVVATPPNPAASVCSYRIDTSQSSWSVNGGTTSIGLKTNCAWSASSDSSWARVATSSGTGNATLSLAVDPNFTTTNRTATVTIGGQIVNVTQASFSATPPFGAFDTPVDNATGLSGAIPVTGWALDDVGVTRVRIYRDPVAGEAAGQQVFIGNATFVDGARPDVQAIYSAFPYASRAGWGLQVLTNMLPNQGNGLFRFYAYADDVDGHTTLLGFKTVMINNATSVLPFGTIDTPGQGDTVSGVVVNFGWALASALIPVDGSTIDVLIDGAVSGHPVYNNFRSDIASLFPNLPNSNGAIGYFVLDTTQLSNGLHTIAWIVRDSNGGAQGIGSRYFTVVN